MSNSLVVNPEDRGFKLYRRGDLISVEYCVHSLFNVLFFFGGCYVFTILQTLSVQLKQVVILKHREIHNTFFRKAAVMLRTTFTRAV